MNVRIAGGHLAYEIHGRGRPLLLIRPLGGPMELWGLFRELLAERLRVISFDLRGSGASSARAPIGTRALASDARQLLDALQVERAHVFGISLGGMAATWLAIDAPERIDKLCIASAPPLGLELRRVSLGRALSMATCFLRARARVEPALVTRVLSHRFRREHPDEVQHIQRIVASAPSSRASLLRHALSGLLHHPGAALSRITAPTLVLAGEHDGMLGSRPPRELARAIRGARFQIIQDAGHDLVLERPVQAAHALLQFLADD